jgi:hypothetical protein
MTDLKKPPKDQEALGGFPKFLYDKILEFLRNYIETAKKVNVKY